MAITIRKTPCPDVDLEINGVNEGLFAAGSTIELNLTDGVNPVTPDDVTVVGNVVTVEVPACPAAVSRSTATLMMTGQTTSYRTGDDGDIEAGRATDFLTLDAPPVHNDGSATLNTTTNRFTDTAGGQAYTDNIVLDWSTWNGSTLLGWYRVRYVTATGAWDEHIDYYLANNLQGYANWRLPNVGELFSLLNHSISNRLNYSPFSVNNFVWTSTTNASNTSQAMYLLTGGLFNPFAKTGTGTIGSIGVRTFSLSTSNILS